MSSYDYLMENKEETLRLTSKTDCNALDAQARWAGVEPGMRVADVGCGPGLTTALLRELVQPGGEATGIDQSETRIAHAQQQYTAEGLRFVCRDITAGLQDLGQFDFVWVRFVLEYFRSNSVGIVKNISSIVRPGGILCLADLDYNCLTYYGISPRLERAIHKTVKTLEEEANFDPYAGRKLYSYLYDLGFQDIKVNLYPHHLIYGKAADTDVFNWTKKIEVISDKFDFLFEEYPGGHDEFREEFYSYFKNPGRFIYTPLIIVSGRKPL
ncbi:MAG: methyltransferase domain-containing protein [Nitrospiraceae bacterium]|jgi:SAM-dependent methyltransferase|nr:MAG: methyltransferase domain-containing protein [Nitrospiraceae bacterium]